MLPLCLARHTIEHANQGVNHELVAFISTYKLSRFSDDGWHFERRAQHSAILGANWKYNVNGRH